MPTQPTPDVTNNTLKIATFNLFNYIEPPLAYYDFENIYSQESWQKKQDWICDYVEQYQPDVIGFQEVFSADALQDLLAKQGYVHFCVVDEPTIIDDYICRDPVVALASRYPIKAVSAISAPFDVAESIGLDPEFSFSRKPLRATIDLPHVGDTDCYVVHLKSKRPMLEASTEQHTAGASTPSAKAQVLATLKAEVIGSWGSSIQRGSEAALLYYAIIERREDTGNPVVLMGDFNDDIQQTPLQCLTTNSIRDRQVSDQKQILDTFWLADSFKLYQTTDHANDVTRSPTHYFGAKGNVLDYILLSCEFNAEYNASLFEVSDYQTYDRHLINPIFDRDGNSTDHGIVNITLSLRS
ncbi:endonuclease/exonuclease/phosphatase family protein [Photobacterium sanguinicancri]|uniref:Endonuclease/exonuclease/phosphatase family protein n=1 Tax=Photobacterium sanguinicancri TaxID=875932 RepID=A0AAW7YDH3_9GAMM|nr:endonuclease/exonuclease/phosphatase family protein [Photobacterium sanguinicancri]MDO6544675.1 endonuclease/exonuclease/phosphatase family protein [Photobacterium sanguinicancri]